jgi:uncharacterized phage protein (TIGR01671 family)
MKEIKFRAFDKRFKKMDFGAGDLLLRINEKDFSEPMQFTGLHDKNGKEIYEGDLLQYENATTGRSTENLLTVSFERGRFVAYGKERKEHEMSYLGTPSFSKNFKIVGNVYETKKES